MIIFAFRVYAGQKRVLQKLEYSFFSDRAYILALGAGYAPMLIVFNHRTFRTPLLLKSLNKTKS